MQREALKERDSGEKISSTIKNSGGSVKSITRHRRDLLIKEPVTGGVEESFGVEIREEISTGSPLCRPSFVGGPLEPSNCPGYSQGGS